MTVHGPEGGVEPGVHGIGSLIQHAATMVGDGLELELEAVSGAEVKGLGGTEPEDEGLLMLVATEDEALPVDPSVESGALSLVADLQAHLGVGGEVELGIVERLDESVLRSALQMPQEDSPASYWLYRGLKVGEEAQAGIAVTITPPVGEVLIGQGSGVACGAPVVEVVDTETQLDGEAGLGAVAEVGSQAIAWEGVVSDEVGGVFVIAEEAFADDLQTEECRAVLRGGAERLFTAVVGLRSEVRCKEEREEER